MPNTCSACPKKFTFPETGSGICQSCNEFYCSECSSIGPGSCLYDCYLHGNKTGGIVFCDRTILCNRCRVLESNEANWDSVMGLNIRDLKWFMRRRNIPSVGLIEKEQFVDAVLNSLGISTRSSNAGDYVFPDSTKRNVKLEDLMSEESIENLSVRQIKDLLVYNFVDFTHCVEKAELIARAKQLWRNYKQQQPPIFETHEAVEVEDCQNAGTSSERCPSDKCPGDLNDECGICMEAPINCVFLECGHLFSCVDCGRKLTECPLCRQSIVRIVRTFRV